MGFNSGFKGLNLCYSSHYNNRFCEIWATNSRSVTSWTKYINRNIVAPSLRHFVVETQQCILCVCVLLSYMSLSSVQIYCVLHSNTFAANFFSRAAMQITRNIFWKNIYSRCRSQWPRGLRRRSAAARLLRSWVRIPPGGMDVCLLWVLCVVR